MKDIDDIPEPHLRLFPDFAERRRRVEVKISRFRGYGRHFYVDMVEEDNPVWDEEAGDWIVTAGDEAGAGQRRVMGFTTERRARRWVEAVFAESFGEETHELCIRDEVTEHHLYSEGD
ncbi:MAG: hypothetical protein ACOCRN_00540 [Spirochaetia bacterium]